MSEEASETKPVEKKKFKEWLKGSNKKEYAERLSYTIIIISAVLIFFGILLGSFVKYTVHLATFGSFLLIIGIIVYIVSQLMK